MPPDSPRPFAAASPDVLSEGEESRSSVPGWLGARLTEAPGAWLPWREVMAEALYGAGHGYYAGEPRRVGRSGDFYTSVSVGPLYGQLLAEQAAASWVGQGRPEHWWLVEQGAHDGQLMADVLTALRERHPAAAAGLRVVLVEPQAGYRAAQEARLRSIGATGVEWVSEVGELPAGPGWFFSNELLDALPVHRVRRETGDWRELGVREGPGGLEWQTGEWSSEAVREEAAKLPMDRPEGFVTEVQLAVLDWVRALAESAFAGEVWIADYGLDAEAYWSLERPEGTLRRYGQHRMDDRVLEDLGGVDLTCHVNFTRLLEEARAAGLMLLEDSDQGALLTRLATPWLRSLEGRPPDAATRALLHQFQTLTHPGLMGRAFRVLRLARA